MTKREKLVQKAIRNPDGLSFKEACKLAKQFGFEECDDSGTSHRKYKRSGSIGMVNLQDFDGKAKGYQVRQMLKLAEALGLIKRG